MTRWEWRVEDWRGARTRELNSLQHLHRVYTHRTQKRDEISDDPTTMMRCCWLKMIGKTLNLRQFFRVRYFFSSSSAVRVLYYFLQHDLACSLFSHKMPLREWKIFKQNISTDAIFSLKIKLLSTIGGQKCARAMLLINGSEWIKQIIFFVES